MGWFRARCRLETVKRLARKEWCLQGLFDASRAVRLINACVPRAPVGKSCDARRRLEICLKIEEAKLGLWWGGLSCQPCLVAVGPRDQVHSKPQKSQVQFFLTFSAACLSSQSNHLFLSVCPCFGGPRRIMLARAIAFSIARTAGSRNDSMGQLQLDAPQRPPDRGGCSRPGA